MYNKGPFAEWVPKPVMLLLIIFIMFSIITVSGIYTSAATETYGGLGAYSEYIAFANNASTIGMGCAMLIAMRVKLRFRSKEIITGGAFILAALSYICGTTGNPLIIVLCSFFIGFFKMFPLMEMILPVMFILSPTGERGRFYSMFYPLILGFSQWSALYMARIVNEAGWESPYLLMSAVLLVVALISQIFQHNQRFGFKMPLYQIDWISLVLLGGSFMSVNYGLVFMRQQAWFNSPSIAISLFGGLLMFIALYFRQKDLKRPLIYFDVFTKDNVKHSIILLLCLGVYLASTSLYTQYTVGVLGYTSLINSEINLWMIPGFVIAGILAFFGFKNKWPIKYYIAAGFICFFVYTFILYMIIQPQMDIRYLEYSMIIKGLGMGILFIGIWFYASLNLPLDKMFGVMSMLIALRSFIATAIGTAFLSWAGDQAQWQSINDIALYGDAADALNKVRYQTYVLNGMMDSEKIILGSLCWFIIPVLLIVATHSYGTFNFRRIVFFRKAIRGNSVKGYNFRN